MAAARSATPRRRTSTAPTRLARRHPGGADATANVTVTVTAAPDATVAGNDAATVAEDSAAAAIDVLANDSDADGPLTITGVTQPANGTVAITGGGSAVSYTKQLIGTNTFSYTVTQGGADTTADVTITVAAVNDAPATSDPTVNPPDNAGVVRGNLNIRRRQRRAELHHHPAAERNSDDLPRGGLHLHRQRPRAIDGVQFARRGLRQLLGCRLRRTGWNEDYHRHRRDRRRATRPSPALSTSVAKKTATLLRRRTASPTRRLMAVRQRTLGSSRSIQPIR